MRTLLALALAALPCLADEVVLKDGGRIEFRSVEDNGDTYTIITPEGARRSVKRSDVEGFSKTQPSVALTGATMTFDKKSRVETVDLLKKADTDKGALAGTWQFTAGGALVGDGAKGSARFQIQHVPPVEEYNLTVVLERVVEGDNVCITFPVPGGAQCMYGLDIDVGAYHGILVPENGGYRRASKTPGKLLAVGKQRTVVFMVRKASFVVQIDGKDAYVTRPNWPTLAVASQGVCEVSALKTTVRISQMALSFVSPK